jgi:DNA-directed RNA polymerase specialized sigma24 family protein
MNFAAGDNRMRRRAPIASEVVRALGRVRAATHLDAYARAVLVREFIHERRSVWVRRVSLGGTVGDSPAAVADQDVVLDLRAAVAALPARQRATLVLRFYCDLNPSDE